jgi:hypothetical protein
VSGIQLPVAGENTTSLKDHIVLVLQQLSAIRTSEKSTNPGEAIIPKYYQNCHKELYENVPNFKNYVDTAIEGHRNKVKEAIERGSTLKNRFSRPVVRLHTALNELGVDYRVSERVADVYMSHVYIPEKDAFMDYSTMRSYLKTDNMQEDKLLDIETHIRHQTIQKGGNKYIHISFHDILEAESDHAEFVKIIKEKVDNA